MDKNKKVGSDDRFNHDAQLKLVLAAKKMVPPSNLIARPRESHIVFHARPKEEDYTLSATP